MEDDLLLGLLQMQEMRKLKQIHKYHEESLKFIEEIINGREEYKKRNDRGRF